jgi:hypothetical protein
MDEDGSAFPTLVNKKSYRVAAGKTRVLILGETESNGKTAEPLSGTNTSVAVKSVVAGTLVVDAKIETPAFTLKPNGAVKTR